MPTAETIEERVARRLAERERDQAFRIARSTGLRVVQVSRALQSLARKELAEYRGSIWKWTGDET